MTLDLFSERAIHLVMGTFDDVFMVAPTRCSVNLWDEYLDNIFQFEPKSTFEWLEMFLAFPSNDVQQMISGESS